MEVKRKTKKLCSGCQSPWNIRALGISESLEYQSPWNIRVLGISESLEYQSPWNIRVLGISESLEYLSPVYFESLFCLVGLFLLVNCECVYLKNKNINFLHVYFKEKKHLFFCVSFYCLTAPLPPPPPPIPPNPKHSHFACAIVIENIYIQYDKFGKFTGFHDCIHLVYQFILAKGKLNHWPVFYFIFYIHAMVLNYVAMILNYVAMVLNYVDMVLNSVAIVAMVLNYVAMVLKYVPKFSPFNMLSNGVFDLLIYTVVYKLQVEMYLIVTSSPWSKYQSSTR